MKNTYQGWKGYVIHSVENLSRPEFQNLTIITFLLNLWEIECLYNFEIFRKTIVIFSEVPSGSELIQMIINR